MQPARHLRDECAHHFHVTVATNKTTRKTFLKKTLNLNVFHQIFDVNYSILILKRIGLYKPFKNFDFLSLLTQISFLVSCSPFRSQSSTELLTGLLRASRNSLFWLAKTGKTLISLLRNFLELKSKKWQPYQSVPWG